MEQQENVGTSVRSVPTYEFGGYTSAGALTSEL